MSKDFDILDKASKTLAPVFGRNIIGISKTEKFSWKPVGNAGDFRWIDKDDLHIDGRYQREVSEDRVRNIASAFDWELFGVLIVSRRPDDGSYWILDGGTRARAAFYRDEVTMLPCMVFSRSASKNGASVMSREAENFYGLNTTHKNVSAYHKLRARVAAGEETACEVQRIIRAGGYQPAQHSGVKNGFQAIACLRGMVEKDPEVAERIFLFCAEMANGDVISRDILSGLFKLQTIVAESGHDLLKQPWKKALASAGVDVLQAEINRHKHLVGKGGIVVCARALLKFLNKGRRKRLSWKAD